MGLVNLDVFARGLFVVGNECGVVVFVKLTRDVVGRVKQGLGTDRQTRQGQNHRQSGAGELFHAVSNRLQIQNKSAIVEVLP